MIYTMHEALRGYCHEGGICKPVNWVYRLLPVVRSWLWSTANSSSFGYVGKLVQVVNN